MLGVRGWGGGQVVRDIGRGRLHVPRSVERWGRGVRVNKLKLKLSTKSSTKRTFGRELEGHRLACDSCVIQSAKSVSKLGVCACKSQARVKGWCVLAPRLRSCTSEGGMTISFSKKVHDHTLPRLQQRKPHQYTKAVHNHRTKAGS
jgi:hypothetical protein